MGVKVTKAHAVPILVVATPVTNRGTARGGLWNGTERCAIASARSALFISSSSLPVLKPVSAACEPALCSSQALETCSSCCITSEGGTPSYQEMLTPSRSARRQLVRTLAIAEPCRVKGYGERIASSPIFHARNLRAW